MSPLDFRLKKTASGPMMTVSTVGHFNEDMTAAELEKFADHVRAKARELRNAANQHARKQRDPWS